MPLQLLGFSLPLRQSLRITVFELNVCPHPVVVVQILETERPHHCCLHFNFIRFRLRILIIFVIRVKIDHVLLAVLNNELVLGAQMLFLQEEANGTEGL
jgi:hypothetical protein